MCRGTYPPFQSHLLDNARWCLSFIALSLSLRGESIIKFTAANPILPEDCQVLAQLLAAEMKKTGATQVDNFPQVLEAYNNLRLEDAHAVCELSEIGSALGFRKTLTAQLTLAVLLNKTLGRIAPKVSKPAFVPPSLSFIFRSGRMRDTPRAELSLFLACEGNIHASTTLHRFSQPFASALLLPSWLVAAGLSTTRTACNKLKEQTIRGRDAGIQERGRCHQRGWVCKPCAGVEWCGATSDSQDLRPFRLEPGARHARTDPPSGLANRGANAGGGAERSRIPPPFPWKSAFQRRVVRFSNDVQSLHLSRRSVFTDRLNFPSPGCCTSIDFSGHLLRKERSPWGWAKGRELAPNSAMQAVARTSVRQQ